jgi:hypothetical protein
MASPADIEMYVGLRVLIGKEEELGDDQVGDLVVDAAGDEDNAVLEQTREDVHLALAPAGGLDNKRYPLTDYGHRILPHSRVCMLSWGQRRRTGYRRFAGLVALAV